MRPWRKLGRVFDPTDARPWMRSYAHLPTPWLLADRIRVFFAGLDENKFGRIGYVDVEIDEPTRVIGMGEDPVLDIGPPGAFDDSGVNPSCVVELGGVPHMYYIGWQRLQRVPYALFAGMARIDHKRAVRTSAAPVLDRCDAEPFLRSATSILPRDGGGFRAWYVSADAWTNVNGNALPALLCSPRRVGRRPRMVVGRAEVHYSRGRRVRHRPAVVRVRRRKISPLVFDPLALGPVPDGLCPIRGRS